MRTIKTSNAWAIETYPGGRFLGIYWFCWNKLIIYSCLKGCTTALFPTRSLARTAFKDMNVKRTYSTARVRRVKVEVAVID